jgi:nicotinate-nucleotide adenylyltransferase
MENREKQKHLPETTVARFSDSPFPIPHSQFHRLHIFYGGTFDPVHLGHVAVARAARDQFGVPVWLTPAADPPHRAPPSASAIQRAEMLGLALEDEKNLFVDLRELRRAQAQPRARSYSIGTLRELRAELGGDTPLAMLIGADSFVHLPEWKQWRKLFDLAHIVIADRPGISLEGGIPAELARATDGRWADAPEALQAAPVGSVFRLRQPWQDESASEIRRRLAAGGPWHELLPARVAAYIAEHGLYATPPAL